MRSSKTIHVVSCHAEGEVGDVIVGGVAPPPGDTLWAQRNWIAKDQTLRNFMLNEPRGGVFRHVNLLVPAKGGLVKVTAECKNGKAERISVQNVASFAGELEVPLDVPGLGTINVDTAYGGDSFVVVAEEAIDLQLTANNAKRLAELGVRITNAANEQLKFTHPANTDWQHFSFCLFAGKLHRSGKHLTAKAAVAIQPGKIDRSPTGTAASARMALMHAAGQMQLGDTFTAESIIGSTFNGRIVSETRVGERAAIIPEISGRAWITGVHQHMLDPDDPWPEGYKLSDTWPDISAG